MFFDQLINLCEEKNTTPTKFVTEILHLSSSKVTAWKNGSIPKYETLDTIANYFDVSIGTLFDGKRTDANLLTADERELLENYRKLDDDKKKEISEKAKMHSDNITVKNELYMELSKIVTSLPLRERSKLITMIYDCEEQYRKYGSMQMPQATDLPTSERQLLETFRQFNDYEQAKVLERIKEWLDVKHRREQINKQKIVGIQIARRNDGTSSGQMPLTAEEAEKIAELPEETNF